MNLGARRSLHLGHAVHNVVCLSLQGMQNKKRFEHWLKDAVADAEFPKVGARSGCSLHF